MKEHKPPTAKELIAKYVEEITERNFEAYRHLREYGPDDVTLYKERVKKGPMVIKSTLQVYGETFTDFNEARAFIKEETIKRLNELADNKPVIFLEDDEGIVPILDGWPGVKYPTAAAWDKIYAILKRKYGEATVDAVRGYVLRRGNELGAIPFYMVLDIEYNPKKD